MGSSGIGRLALTSSSASLLACLLLAACGGGSSPSISIDEPAEGATVESPVAVVLGSEGLEGEEHVHLLVDLPCDEPGTTEPEGEQRLWLDPGVEELEVPLPPGEHTLCAQVADADHIAGEVTAEVTFVVSGGGAGGGETTTEEEEEEAGAEAWEGPVTGTFQAGPDCTPGTSTGQIKLVVDEAGAVEGLGITRSSEYTCTFPEGSSTIPEASISYTITGTKSPEAFELTFEDGVTMTLEISGTTATGTQDNSAGGGYTSVSTVELTCVEGC